MSSNFIAVHQLVNYMDLLKRPEENREKSQTYLPNVLPFSFYATSKCKCWFGCLFCFCFCYHVYICTFFCWAVNFSWKANRLFKKKKKGKPTQEWLQNNVNVSSKNDSSLTVPISLTEFEHLHQKEQGKCLVSKCVADMNYSTWTEGKMT